MKIFLTTLCLTLCAATANAAFIYNIDRTIGDGTVTGIIETDGTQGILTKDNIIDWSITLTSANLVGGSDTFDFSTGDTILRGTAVSADSTGLWYDFELEPSTRGNYFLLQSNSGTGNFWCLQTNVCSTGFDKTEHIGINATGGIAEWEARSGKIAFATVIPVPAAVWLFASGLLGLIGVSRLKR
mgnify:CR=1 FL=1